MYQESDPDPAVAYTVYLNRHRRARLMHSGKTEFQITQNNGRTWQDATMTDELKAKWSDALARQKVAINEILEML